MSLHYYSDALGLTFGNTNEEVYDIDQIKRWAPLEPPDPKWLEPPGPLRMSLGGVHKLLLQNLAFF